MSPKISRGKRPYDPAIEWMCGYHLRHLDPPCESPKTAEGKRICDDPAHRCSQPKMAGRLFCYGHERVNKVTRAAEIEREEKAAAEKQLRRARNILADLELPLVDDDPIASLREALRVASWRELGLRMMVQARDAIFGANHLGDEVEDVVSKMHAEALEQRAKIARSLAEVTTGSKVTIETKFAELAKLSDAELDAAIAEAERIVAKAREASA